MKKQFVTAVVKSKHDGKGTFHILASTDAVDRDGDVIVQSGWDLDNFIKNGVILWAHDNRSLPIGKATDTRVTDRGLEIRGVFASHEFAQTIRTAVEEEIVNAVSVGFMPKERGIDEDGLMSNEITRAELYEVSFVPVPSNPEALSVAQAKGLDMNLFVKQTDDESNDDENDNTDDDDANDGDNGDATDGDGATEPAKAATPDVSPPEPRVRGREKGRPSEGTEAVVEMSVEVIRELRRETRSTLRHHENIMRLTKRVLKQLN